MFHGVNTRRLWSTLFCTGVLVSAALVVSPSAGAKFGGNEPCVASNGRTLNQIYGYSVSVISPDCDEVPAAKRWTPSVPWIMNDSFEQVPSGFTTDLATPVDDLRNKLKTIELVVDPGSAYQTNRSFPNDAKLWVGQLPEAAGFPAVNSANLGALDPLPVGQHSVAVYWNFKAPHCDGFTTSQATSCLPEGKTLVRQISFEVVAPQPAA
jgi:hypothetical protein